MTPETPDGGWAVSTFLPWKRGDGKEQDLESSDGYGTGYGYPVESAEPPSRGLAGLFGRSKVSAG